MWQRLLVVAALLQQGTCGCSSTRIRNRPRPAGFVAPIAFVAGSHSQRPEDAAAAASPAHKDGIARLRMVAAGLPNRAAPRGGASYPTKPPGGSSSSSSTSSCAGAGTALSSPDAPVGGAIFNLIKNIVGSGILALPAGVAAFSSSRAAMFPAGLLILALGALSGYCFSLIGRACAATGAKTYGEAWARTAGPETAWLPSASCTAKTFFACLSYSIIIGDSFSDIARAFGAPAWLAWRPATLAAVSSFALLPLCLLKDLRPLSYTSLLGIVGTLYTAGVMALRYFDGSYAPGGAFFAAAAAGAKPLFGGSAALNPVALVLVSTLSTAFIAHYNAPKFMSELKSRGVATFNGVVSTSFGASIALFVAMTAFPFLTFGSACKGFVLNNYATADGLATLCRLAIGLSILFGYPLTFITAREGVLAATASATGVDVSKPSDRAVKISTVALLALFTAGATFLRDLGFVVAFGGAVLGSAIIYVYPALMWAAKCRADAAKGIPVTGLKRAEYVACYGVAGLGTVLGVLGAVVSVLKTFVW